MPCPDGLPLVSSVPVHTLNSALEPTLSHLLHYTSVQVYRGLWRGMDVAVKALMFHDAGAAARRARERAVNEAAVNTLLSHEAICNM